MKIIKRDGSEQNFNSQKILNAIKQAYIAASIDVSEEELEQIVNEVLDQLSNDAYEVEAIQDIVEQVLMAHQPLVAIKYIRYREWRTQQRLSRGYLKQSIDGIVNIESNDVTAENANMSSQTPAGQMMNIASEAAKDYALNYLVPERYRKLHEDGYIHIHDLDYYPTKTTTCVQYDLKKLFNKGFTTKNGYVRSPQSIMSYATLATIVFQTNQNEQHGGQSIPAFDFFMAPGVLKSFRKIMIDLMSQQLMMQDMEVDYPLTKNLVQETIISIDADLSDLASLKKQTKLIDQLDKLWLIGLQKVRKETEQAMEGFIHNLNTMHSRGGNQVVFSSINYGTDTSSEGRMVIESILKMTQQGMGNGEVPVFPIQIFKVKEGVNISDEDLKAAYQQPVWDDAFFAQSFKAKNFDLFLKSVLTTAKSLFPNFVFLDTPYNKNDLWNESDPDRYLYEVATMGCRTRVFENLYGQTSSVSRGNASFTTINLVRLAIEANQKYPNDKEKAIVEFQIQAKMLVEEVADQLKTRLDFQKSAKALQYPFLMYNGVWLDGEKKNPNDNVDEILNHGTLGIGFIGGHHAMKMLVGEGHGESQEAYDLLYDTLKMMKAKIDELKVREQLNYALLATPAEGLSGRFTRLDRKHFGEIEGVTDRDYYVNSFHIDVKKEMSAIEKIKLEAPFHALTLGGHITYVEVDGEAKKNPHALLKIVEAMYRSGIGYGSINHPVDQCVDCQYRGIIYYTCPKCGSARIRRMRRITGYLTGDLSTWNKAKQAEEKDRVKHQ